MLLNSPDVGRSRVSTTLGLRLQVVCTDISRTDLAVAARALSTNEIARARRLRSSRNRHRYVAAHGALRQIVAAELGAPAREVRFTRGPGGKPMLDPAHGSDICFNLSHSAGLAIVAVAQDRRCVGVDVERVRAVPHALLAQHCLTPAERRSVASVTGSVDASAGFLSAWTAKEAYVKALGVGLGADLADAPFDWLQGTVRVVTEDGFHIAALPLGPEYCAAVATGPERLEAR